VALHRTAVFDEELELMGFHCLDGRVVAALFAASFMTAVAGCQSGDSASVLDPGGSKAPEGKVLESDLRAYCPPVNLREGTAFHNTYAKGGDEDPTKLIYQSSLTAVTRKCNYAAGSITMEIAVAGKVVPGPLATDSTVKMPIRIAVSDTNGQVLYSNLASYEVTVARASGATQFVYTDPNVTFPTPAPGTVQVFAGYDEGPDKKKKAAADQL